MKIEICSETSSVAIVAVITVAITIVLCTLTTSYNERTKAAFASGYEEATLPGTSATAWVKAKK